MMARVLGAPAAVGAAGISLVFLWASSVAVAQVPSRLRVMPPVPDAAGLRLAWDVPGDGWTFEVQEAPGLSGPWVASPSGAVGAQRSWRDPRGYQDADQRVFRVLHTPPPVARGMLLSLSKTATYPAAQLSFLLLLQGIPLTAQFDVEVYKLVYRTVDPWGLPTVASAGLAVPVKAGRAWPLLGYQHGTLLRKLDAPSSGLSTEGVVGVLLATSGYVGVSADYLGLGDSPGRHPYHHAASQATAVVDALRAGRAACATNGVTLSGQVFLAGYSQGGHATMATLREIESRHAAEFEVAACAPMAGAFDLSGVTLDDALSDRPVPNPYYFAFLLQTLVDLYGVAPSLSELLEPPYDQSLPPLLDGSTDGGAVNALMPSIPNRIVKPGFLAALRADPGHPLRRALRDNDLTSWAPRAPVRLYHCSGDQDVVPGNAVVARERMAALGVAVPLVDPKAGASHGDCAQPALLLVKAWFDSLRR